MVLPSDPTTELPPPTASSGQRPAAFRTVETRVPAELSSGLAKLANANDIARAHSVVSHLVAAAAEEAEPATPEELCGKHAVQGEIGRGGMGRILRVRDNDLNREVAMKVLIDETSKDAPPNYRRFVEEAQITSQLEHPHVLPVHELGVTDEGDIYFTMKFIRGHRTLREVIEALLAGDPAAYAEFSFERRVQIVQMVCNALHYAHLRGVIHRDLKPDNIVLGSCGEVYLVDWGVAKVLGAPERCDQEDAVEQVETFRVGGPHETREGSLIGTPYYMSPEQATGRNEQVSPASDVYCLCVVLYELLSLRHYLWDAHTRNLGALVVSIASHEPRPAESFVHPHNGRVPRHLSRIVARGLAKRPEQRYASVVELSDALQAWLEGRAPIVCPGTFIQRVLARWSALIDRYPFLAPALTIVLLALLLGSLTLSGAVIAGVI